MNSTYMLGAAILLGGPVAAQQSQADGQKPNVIFIYADDLGYGDLECYGATRVQTPHVNRLANEGIRFTNAHATAARYFNVCSFVWEPGYPIQSMASAPILTASSAL